MVVFAWLAENVALVILLAIVFGLVWTRWQLGGGE